METEPTRTPDVLSIRTTEVSLSVCSVKLISFDHICLRAHVRINFLFTFQTASPMKVKIMAHYLQPLCGNTSFKLAPLPRAH